MLELAIQGMADACFPETVGSRGSGQVLAARDQMSRTVEQLVSGKVRVGARHMLPKGSHSKVRRRVCHVKQLRI